MTQTFSVTFSRNIATILVLITLPLVTVGFFIVPLVLLPELPEWVIFTTICIALGGAILLMIRFLKRYVTVPAEVAVSESGINIKLLKSTPVYFRKVYTSTWEGIENVSSNVDTQQERQFYLVRFRNPAKTVSLMTDEVASADQETPFGEALLGFVSRYNDSHQSTPNQLIHHRGFFDGLWATALTIFSYLAIIGVFYGYFTNRETFGFWRVIQVLCFSGAWLIAYHTNRHRGKV
ncbi:MAG: hypothetical protein ABI378_13070 [Chitinophagaceae bacterium]